MKHFQLTQEILDSWRRCMEGGILSTLASSMFCLEGGALEVKQKENELLLSIFVDSTKNIDSLITVQHCFLLISPNRILLKKKREKFKKG